jgi:hypothetical protein
MPTARPTSNKLKEGESMKKQIAIGICAAGLLLAAGEKQKFTGVITDSACATANHKSMQMGPTDAKCVTECVKGMGAKYALYDGKATYTLSDHKDLEKFAAKKVTVTGTLDGAGKTLHVDSIAAAK